MKNRWIVVTVTNSYDPRGSLAEHLASGALDAEITAVLRRNKTRLQELIKKPTPGS